MTCIVALRTPNTIYFAGDSLVKIDNEIFTIKQSKIFKRGPHLFGVAGSPRLLNILQYDSDIPDRIPGQSTEDYANISLIDSFRVAFREAGYMEKYGGREQTDSKALFTVDDHIFYLGESLSLIEIEEDYISIGAGASYAMSSLYTTERSCMKPENRIKKALSTAEKFSPLVSRPFKIISIPIEPGGNMPSELSQEKEDIYIQSIPPAGEALPSKN